MSFGSAQLGAVPFGTELFIGSAPYVTFPLPADQSVIAPLDALTFVITAPNGLRRCVVCADFPASGTPPELVHDGDRFRALYGNSVRDDLTPGYVYRYTLVRGGGGWRGRPTLRVFATDLIGLQL
jgi:hypothetical protein